MKVAGLARVFRTFRSLRGAQAFAQARHLLLARGISPIEFHGDVALATSSTPVPFLPPPTHARGRVSASDVSVSLLGRDVVFREAIDWETEAEGPLFAYHLHQFDYLRCGEISAEERSACLHDWIERHRRGVGWDPHPISHRILAWGKLMLTPDALPGAAGDEVVLRSLVSQVETLSQNLEVRLQANHLFTNLLAVVFGGLLLDAPESESWLARSDALLGELRDQIHPDGSHEERSPMYHALLLEQVLDLLNLARGVPARAPDALIDSLEDAAARMCGALEVWTHPDGDIALFSDAGIGIAQRPASLDEYAAALGVAVQRPEHPDQLDRGGFARIADEDWHLIASVGGPAPPHQPGHAHCDALAFELSVLGQRVVTDTGVFEYLPGPDRDASRATRSHATIEVDGCEQAELWAAHRVGGRPLVRVLDLEPGQAVEASCQGWSTPDVVHRRRYELDEGRLEIHDQIDASRDVSLRLMLPLAPGLRARLVGAEGGARTLHVALDADRAIDVELPGAHAVAWRLEKTDYFESFGRRQQRWCLVGESDDFREGVWRFRLL